MEIVLLSVLLIFLFSAFGLSLYFYQSEKERDYAEFQYYAAKSLMRWKKMKKELLGGYKGPRNF